MLYRQFRYLRLFIENVHPVVSYIIAAFVFGVGCYLKHVAFVQDFPTLRNLWLALAMVPLGIAAFMAPFTALTSAPEVRVIPFRLKIDRIDRLQRLPKIAFALCAVLALIGVVIYAVTVLTPSFWFFGCLVIAVFVAEAFYEWLEEGAKAPLVPVTGH